MVEPWMAVSLLAGSMMGLASPVVVSRGLSFLIAEMTHAVVFAASGAAVLSSLLGYGDLWLFALSVVPLYLVAFLRRMGVRDDVAIGVLGSLLTSLSLILLYVALTAFGQGARLWAYMLGDPLLTTWRDIEYIAVVGAASTVPLLAFFRDFVLAGFDPDYARLMGLRLALYDVALLTFVGLTAAVLIRVVGIFMVHVLLIVPGATALALSRTLSRVPAYSMGVALASMVGGMALATATGVAPSGLIGVVATSIYVAAIALRRAR